MRPQSTHLPAGGQTVSCFWQPVANVQPTRAAVTRRAGDMNASLPQPGASRCRRDHPIRGVRAIARLGGIATSLGACAPVFVPRAPGVHVYDGQHGIALTAEEREGTPGGTGTGTVRYDVRIDSEFAPASVRASLGASGERCAPDAPSLGVAAIEAGPFGLAGYDEHGSWSIAVPAGAPAPAADVAVTEAEEASTCLRIPLEGEAVRWRPVKSPLGVRVAYALGVPASPVAQIGVEQMGLAGLSRWWGPLRGTAFLGAGDVNPRNGRFAATAGVDLDAFPILGSSWAFGAGVRYAPFVTWLSADFPDPTVVQGLFGMLEVTLWQSGRERLHGLVQLDPVSFELHIPVGLWTTAPGKGSQQSLALGFELSFNYRGLER